jgi:hypothetical protein
MFVGALLLCAVSSKADTLTYNFVTSSTPEGVITTSLPASPVPTSFTATSFEYTVPLIVDGEAMTIPVDFFTAAAGGGAAGQGTRVEGPVLFMGSTSAPTFLTGTFAFGDFTLTVTPQTAPVPEPSTLLLLGLGAVTGGGLIRRKAVHRDYR